jgi:hypothetical protein
LLSATLGGLLVFLLASALRCLLRKLFGFFGALRWHPRFAFVLQASPRTGATPEWQTPSRGCQRKGKKIKSRAQQTP